MFASTSAAYGDSPFVSKREVDAVAPLSPYAAAKLAGEFYCRAFAATYGLETVAIRYFNVFGPRQDPNSAYAAVIPLFIDALLEGRAPTIHGDGEQSRDFTYVVDVVQGLVLATLAPAGTVANIGGGTRISLRDAIAMIGEVASRPFVRFAGA